MYRRWPCPLPGGAVADESALVLGGDAPARVLVLPPLFDEANKFRAQVVAIMRILAADGVASVLPDLPGWNDSLAPFADQTLAHWRRCAEAAAGHFGARAVLALRGGGWIAPAGLPGWLYAPTRPPQVLRALLRARTLAAREAGRAETAEAALALGRAEGLVLGGWPFGAALLRELEDEAPATTLAVIAPDALPGRPLWLRAEPDRDADQAAALAQIVRAGLAR